MPNESIRTAEIVIAVVVKPDGKKKIYTTKPKSFWRRLIHA